VNLFYKDKQHDVIYAIKKEDIFRFYSFIQENNRLPIIQIVRLSFTDFPLINYSYYFRSTDKPQSSLYSELLDYDENMNFNNLRK